MTRGMRAAFDLCHSTRAETRSGGVLDANCVKSFGDEVAVRRYCVRVAHGQGNARSNVWPRLSRESWQSTHDARDKLVGRDLRWGRRGGVDTGCHLYRQCTTYI